MTREEGSLAHAHGHGHDHDHDHVIDGTAALARVGPVREAAAATEVAAITEAAATTEAAAVSGTGVEIANAAVTVEMTGTGSGGHVIGSGGHAIGTGRAEIRIDHDGIATGRAAATVTIAVETIVETEIRVIGTEEGAAGHVVTAGDRTGSLAPWGSALPRAVWNWKTPSLR